MEPITFMAIVAFLVSSSTTTIVDQATTDAYEYLKGKLKSKFGDQSEVANAVDGLENKPDSEGRKVVLREEIEQAGADQDPDVEAAARALLDQLGNQPGGEQHIQTARGSYIAQAQESSTATVDVDQPGERATE
ncbi:MAG: hypothetical protein H0T57_14940 [Rubrobacter sp.]|nr:hypothetical protein [Rubrobacter sp.]